jgi:hypothetical protein
LHSARHQSLAAHTANDCTSRWANSPPAMISSTRRLTMYEDEILRETWRVKEQLGEEFSRDPKAYWAKLRRIGRAWKTRTKDAVTPTRKSTKRIGAKSAQVAVV